MAARHFLGDISINRREHTLELHVSTDMADAQRSDWQKSVSACGLQQLTSTDTNFQMYCHILVVYLVHCSVDDAQKLQRAAGSTSFVTAQTDLKGLSGGERSYSTLAFTMALENVISVPFCCLDEFDVVSYSVSVVSIHTNPRAPISPVPS